MYIWNERSPSATGEQPQVSRSKGHIGCPLSRFIPSSMNEGGTPSGQRAAATQGRSTARCHLPEPQQGRPCELPARTVLERRRPRLWPKSPRVTQAAGACGQGQRGIAVSSRRGASEKLVCRENRSPAVGQAPINERGALRESPRDRALLTVKSTKNL